MKSNHPDRIWVHIDANVITAANSFDLLIESMGHKFENLNPTEILYLCDEPNENRLPLE
jgi:hypothetical protein